MAQPTDSATRLLSESVGKRVSIRLHDPSGGFRDLLGTLIAIDQVEKRDGSIVTFDKKKIFAFRIVENSL
jgi:hypothetical protein